MVSVWLRYDLNLSRIRILAYNSNRQNMISKVQLGLFSTKSCHQEGVMPDHFWQAGVAVISGTLNQPGFHP